jgi:hypothetical protein
MSEDIILINFKIARKLQKGDMYIPLNLHRNLFQVYGDQILWYY